MTFNRYIFAFLQLASITVGGNIAFANQSGSAEGNNDEWSAFGYGNGAGTCFDYLGTLGEYCMNSTTGWVQIDADKTLEQQVGCENNANTNSANGNSLQWSLYNNTPFINNGPWYYLINQGIAGYAVAWATGNNGYAYLSQNNYTNSTYAGGPGGYYGSYGYAGVNVSNVAAYGGYFQAAVGCTNSVPANASPAPNSMVAQTSATVTPISFAPKSKHVTMDSVDLEKGKAFLAREYVLQKGKTIKDTRECPVGMHVVGERTWTIQEFPADHQEPKWKERAIVKVNHNKVGATKVKHTMRLTRAKHPTVVQFQIRCSK